MATFSDYYRDLLNWEGIDYQSLIEKWPSGLADEVELNLRLAVRNSQIVGLRCPIRPGSTNQSIGNQVEEFCVSRMTIHSHTFKIQKCSGAGYPDYMLVRATESLRMPFEVKATSDWNPTDSNRRVLTSSSEKLRKQFQSPIFHVLMTIVYLIQEGTVEIKAVRIDFIEPNTPVNVRLEASVSHKILTNASHRYFLI